MTMKKIQSKNNTASAKTLNTTGWLFLCLMIGFFTTGCFAEKQITNVNHDENTSSSSILHAQDKPALIKPNTLKNPNSLQFTVENNPLLKATTRGVSLRVGLNQDWTTTPMIGVEIRLKNGALIYKGIQRTKETNFKLGLPLSIQNQKLQLILLKPNGKKHKAIVEITPSSDTFYQL
jgi:hypothetical protein